MPHLRLQTNQEISDQKELVQGLSKLVASELGKPENYVMITLEKELCMSMGGNLEPVAFVELKSLGLPKTATASLSKAICEFLQENINISPDRVYIVFSDIERNMWGWNGSTF